MPCSNVILLIYSRLSCAVTRLIFEIYYSVTRRFQLCFRFSARADRGGVQRNPIATVKHRKYLPRNDRIITVIFRLIIEY